ncbi:MAG TPA: nuclear transport factor 2 family protein [Acidimicrobiia bacterium]|nr:nuclear transport factor 2 family protein [Acidimicrobiia bacterium]
MITNEQAEEFAREWYEAWNALDLDRILSHWSDDAVFTSPLAAKLLGEATVEGKEALRAYWRKGIDANPGLHFEPRALLVGYESIVLSYVNHKGVECAEVLVIGADGRARRGLAHYGG